MPGVLGSVRLPRVLKAALAVGLVFGVAVVGTAGVSAALIAHHSDWPLEREVAEVGLTLAAKLGTQGLTQPDLPNQARARAPITYAGMCAQCHGSTGTGNGAFGATTYPPAASLVAHDAVKRSDAELYWIVKNGISLTGMPGFGGQLTDRDAWGLVWYLRQLQAGGAPVYTPASASERVTAPADGVARGAAVYFTQNCAQCHGSRGDGPGDMGLRNGRGEVDEAVRKGKAGMPTYPQSMISDQDLEDLKAYLAALANPAQTGTQPAQGGEGNRPARPNGGGGQGNPQGRN